MATTYLIATEDFSKSFTISEFNELETGVYNIYENGRIKHHHNIVITDDEAYYVASFDRSHDDELEELINDTMAFGFLQLKSLERHPAQWGVFAEYSTL